MPSWKENEKTYARFSGKSGQVLRLEDGEKKAFILPKPQTVVRMTGMQALALEDACMKWYVSETNGEKRFIVRQCGMILRSHLFKSKLLVLDKVAGARPGTILIGFNGWHLIKLSEVVKCMNVTKLLISSYLDVAGQLIEAHLNALRRDIGENAFSC